MESIGKYTNNNRRSHAPYTTLINDWMTILENHHFCLIETKCKYYTTVIWCIDYYNNNRRYICEMHGILFCNGFKRRVKCQKCTPAINNFLVNFSVSIICVYVYNVEDAALWWWLWENSAYIQLFVKLLFKISVKMCAFCREFVCAFLCVN